MKADKPEALESITVGVDQPAALELLVKGYVLGEGLTMDLRVWGLKNGKNTVLIRVGWWELRFLETIVKILLGRKVG